LNSYGYLISWGKCRTKNNYILSLSSTISNWIGYIFSWKAKLNCFHRIREPWIASKIRIGRSRVNNKLTLLTCYNCYFLRWGNNCILYIHGKITCNTSLIRSTKEHIEIYWSSCLCIVKCNSITSVRNKTVPSISIILEKQI